MKAYSVNQSLTHDKAMTTKDTRQSRPLRYSNNMDTLQVVDIVVTSDNKLLCKLDLVSESKCVDVPLNQPLVNHVGMLYV